MTVRIIATQTSVVFWDTV